MYHEHMTPSTSALHAAAIKAILSMENRTAIERLVLIAVSTRVGHTRASLCNTLGFCLRSTSTAVRRLVDSGLVSETRLRDGSIGDCVRVLSPEWEVIIGGLGA